MERNDKMIHLFLSAAIMIFVIAAALIFNQPKEKAKKEPVKQEQINHKSDTKSTEEVTEETETTTAEKMTEAPKDTSDWESQEAADTTPDTGEPIE